jgi:tRNA (cytidine/uridine-2'-O-)-methyltransferase
MKSSQEKNTLNIVLVEPEIPQNTGNVGRTCVGLGATLHLVGQLGFSLDERALKRAGLDYWPKLKLRVHDSWESFLTCEKPENTYFFSTKGATSLWDTKISGPAYIIFGKESSGFPPKFYSQYASKLVRIPVLDTIRSLNLATAVGVAAFEAARQLELTLC